MLALFTGCSNTAYMAKKNSMNLFNESSNNIKKTHNNNSADEIEKIKSGNLMCQMKTYLPPLNKVLNFYGLAEYSHTGVIKKISSSNDNEIYNFVGKYNDGSGIPDKFNVQYILNYKNGTVTEKVISNERTKNNKINSDFTNLNVIIFPINQHKTWSQSTNINGKNYIINSEIIDYNEKQGIFKVKYSVNNIQGYYNNKYYEIRTFKKGYGMIEFSCLKPVKSDLNKNDNEKVNNAQMNSMFGYSLNK